MKPIKKRAVSGNNLADRPEGSSSSDAAPVSKVNNNNDSVSSPNNPTSSTNDIKSSTTPQSQPSTHQPSNKTNTTTVKRSHKKRESTHNKNKSQPLFAFNAASPLINDPNNPSSTNSSNPNNSTQIGIRPKRKLKQITRFNPYSYHNNSSTSSNVKCGEGFSCPRCNYVCSYDSKQCEECELECYYEAGVGVVTLKERRVSLVGTNSVKKVDRKTEVRKLSEMGKGIRRKSAPPAVSSTAASSSTASDTGDDVEDKPGDLLLTQQQSKDTITSNSTVTLATTSSNTTQNNTNIETKKVGGRPAKSRSSITNVSNSLYQGAIINPLKCPHCSKDFLSEKGLQYHVGKYCLYIVFYFKGFG